MIGIKLKQIVGSAIGVVMGAVLALPAAAGYVDFGEALDFSLLDTAWDPGVDTARLAAGNPAPGGATWSIMGAGIAANAAEDPHGGSFTTLLGDLYAGGVFDEITTIGLTLDKWAAVSGFTNLGMVADSGGAFGAAGSTGDIRVGAILDDGAGGTTDTLAHAFNPCITGFCGPDGSIGGDMHFDNGNTWADDAAATTSSGAIDFHTVALHELGHALGLGHSSVVGSVMEPFYAGARRDLHADDIAGIQSIYGTSVVPLPAGFVLMGSALVGLMGLARRRRSAVNTSQAV